MPGSDPEPLPAAALRQRGLRPRKRLGQNFLQDRSVLDRIVRAAEVGPSDEVLELGAGTGALTAVLASRAGRVVAVELDDALAGLLTTELSGRSNVQVLHANVLDVDPCRVFDGPYKLVGNIPYYVTGQIVRRFLEVPCRPAVMVLMVQREVAGRMTARPGRLSLLSVAVQYAARAEIVARVPAGAFYPRPRVDSALVRLTPHEQVPAEAERRAFFEVARAGFQLRRKQLANSLSAGLGLGREEVREMLRQAGIAESRRPETLSLAEWRRLADVWRGSPHPSPLEGEDWARPPAPRAPRSGPEG